MRAIRGDKLWVLKSGFEEHKAYRKYLKKRFQMKVFDDLASLRRGLEEDSDLPDIVLFRPLSDMQLLNFGVQSKLEWDSISRKINRQGERPIELTSREFQIFSTLLNARDSTVSRSTLVAAVWSDIRVGVKTLDVHLFNLRKKLSRVGFEIIFSPPDTFVLRERHRNSVQDELKRD